MIGPTMKRFRALQIEFDLEESEHYRYLQICHFLRTNSPLSIQLPWRITLYLTKHSTNIKGISLFSNALNDKLTFTKHSHIEAWKRQLKEHYTPDQWQHALQTTYTSFKCNNLWELTQKILMRWYLTPYRISKFDPKASPLCWKCNNIGTLYHILWECPKVRMIWNKVFDMLAQIIKQQLHITSGLAILSLGIDSLPKNTRMIVSHVLLSTRLVITRHWKDQEPPTMKEIILNRTHMSLMKLCSLHPRANFKHHLYSGNRGLTGIHQKALSTIDDL